MYLIYKNTTNTSTEEFIVIGFDQFDPLGIGLLFITNIQKDNTKQKKKGKSPFGYFD